MELKNISIETALKKMGACNYPRTVKDYGRAWKYAYENCSKNSLYQFLEFLELDIKGDIVEHDYSTSSQYCPGCKFQIKFDQRKLSVKELRETFSWPVVKEATLKMLEPQ